MNDSTKSLSERIEEAGDASPETVYRIRRQMEEETGIPMEEDDIGESESEIVDLLLGDICRRME